MIKNKSTQIYVPHSLFGNFFVSSPRGKMRKLLHTLLVTAIVAVPLFLQAREQSESTSGARKKVAVVLSGGGAKGVAHIGALKIIEQAGIPIDIVVGTSMGAIVGGFYSIGYTPEQLEEMVLSQDWSVLLSDRTPRRRQPYSEKENDDRYQVTYPFGRGAGGMSGLVQGTNLDMLFSDMTAGYHDSLDFRTLPIPFACVATNIVDGSQVVFNRGILPSAMRASMAIPGFFTPVYEDNAVLVDGGLINNFPTDVARSMGADIIIGVDVQSGLMNQEELSGAAQVMRQIIELNMQQQDYPVKVADSDIYVKVNVEGYSSQSFNQPALDTLIRRGYESTLTQYGNLLQLKNELGLGEEYSTPPRAPFKPLSDRGPFRVYNISFEGLTARQQRWVMRKCNIEENSDMTVARLDHCVSILGAAASHSGIYYSMRDTLGGYNLHFHMNAVKGNSVSAGVNFDTEEISSVLVNGTFRLGRKIPMEASVTGRFGKRLAVEADYTFLLSPLSGFKLNYAFNHNDININSGGKRLYNPTYNRNYGSLSFVNMNFLRQNLRMELGLAFQRYQYLSFLTNYRDFENDGVAPPGIDDNLMANLDADMWSYFARFDYETLDSRYFTRRGTALSLDFDIFTDNFYQWKEHAPFAALAMSWTTAFPLSRNFSIIPSVYGRVVSGRDIPFPMLNMIGGKDFGRYMPHQLPFEGIGYMEAAPNIFVSAKMQARQRINRRHYISGSLNYGVAADEFFALAPEGKNYLGGSLDYGYDLRNFPLQVSLNWSNITHSVGFYFQAGYMF
jgi:NTE family protein